MNDTYGDARVKRKKLIFSLSISVIVITLGVAAFLVVFTLLRVDYASTYKVAKELKPLFYKLYHSDDCDEVINFVKSSSKTPKEYGKITEKCKDIYNSSIDGLISELGDTDGVRKDDEIRSQFETLKAAYETLAQNESEALSNKLVLWRAMHDFNYASNGLRFVSSSDADFKTAANYLINSGNKALEEFGEGWLERSLEAATAYRNYRLRTTSTADELYGEFDKKQRELNDWVAKNKPAIEKISPLNFDENAKVYTEFTKLYDLIAAKCE